LRVGADLRDETRAFNDALRLRLAALPPSETVPVDELRRARYEGTGVFPAPEFDPAARWADAKGVRVRVLDAAEPRGVYLHIHGGGWCLGAADLQDRLLTWLVRETSLTVVSVDYRLAPEHPYPAAVEDCVSAARWLLDGGIEAPRRLAVGGESAGAHLSVATLQQLGAGHGFAGANLLYGGYDLGGTPSRRSWSDILVMSDPFMAWATENFTPGLDHESRRAPEISPLYGDLTGMPPALFTVGSADPLLDDSLFMAARWEAAGNDCELLVYEDAVHAFNAFPTALAQRANEAQAAFLTRVVAAAGA
jgi:acetyl esterase/lipase